MAAAGFYQLFPHTDAVSCFCCDVRMERWNQQSDPITEHQRASPSCTWNNGTYMTTTEERLGSFHTWPINIKPLPVTMAAAGFYHHNKATDGVTCFSCKLALRDWKKEDDPIQMHIEHTPFDRPCSWISTVTNQPSQYVPPTPPPTPPIAETLRKPRKCQACHKTFSSGNQFHKHRREAQPLIRGRLGVTLTRPVVKKPGLLLLGRHRVTKTTSDRQKNRRKNGTDLFGRDIGGHTLGRLAYSAEARGD